MDDELEQEMIHRQMEQTRASMSEKIAALEDKVAGTVHNTAQTVEDTTKAVSDAVTGTIDSVKETAEEVVENVKETAQAMVDKVEASFHSVAQAFDVTQHVRRHPWLAVGTAMTAGCMAAYFLTGGRSRRREDSRVPRSLSDLPSPQPSYAREQPREKEKGWVGEQLEGLKKLAIGTLLGTLRDLTVRSLPEAVGKKLAEEVDRLTSRFGGEPIQGDVLPREEPEGEQSSGDSDEGGASRAESESASRQSTKEGGRKSRFSVPNGKH